MRPIRHGTHDGYTNRRCRCDDCRAFVRQYNRDLYRRHRDGEFDYTVDEIAVERRCRGDRTVRLNRAEKHAGFAYLNRHGYSSRAIAERLGVADRTVVRWRTGTVWKPPREDPNAALKPSPAEPEQPGELAS